MHGHLNVKISYMFLHLLSAIIRAFFELVRNVTPLIMSLLDYY